jgi:hypothetical protein
MAMRIIGQVAARGAQSCQFPNMPSVVGRNARRLTKSVAVTLSQLKADLSHVFLLEQLADPEPADVRGGIKAR